MLEANTDASIEANQKLHVTYEDFVRSPKSMTHKICKLLGLAWEAAMVNPYESQSVQTFQSHDGEIATTDPKLLQRKQIDPRSAEKWRFVRPIAPLNLAACSIAAQIGYDTALQCHAPGEFGAMPLVCVHGFDGRCGAALPLSKHLPPSTPVFGLEAEYLHWCDPGHLQFEDLKQYGVRLAAYLSPSSS